MDQATPRQQQVLDAIRDLTAEAGYPPTLRELGERLGIRSMNGVADHLKALKAKGHVSWQPASARTLQVVKRPG